MMKSEGSVVINRPIEEVFAFVTDHEKMPQWVSELVEVKDISEGPWRVGTTFTHVVQAMGRRIEPKHEITEYEPNSKLAFGSTSGDVPTKFEITLESVEGGTKFTIMSEAEIGGFFKLAEPIVGRLLQRQWETNVANLKDLLEAQD